MQAIGMAKPLTHEFKFTARTSPGLWEAFNGLVNKAAMRGIKFRGRKVGNEAILNAVVIRFLELSEAEQLIALNRGVSAFEAMMETNETSLAPPPRTIIVGPERDETAHDDALERARNRPVRVEQRKPEEKPEPKGKR